MAVKYLELKYRPSIVLLIESVILNFHKMKGIVLIKKQYHTSCKLKYAIHSNENIIQISRAS